MADKKIPASLYKALIEKQKKGGLKNLSVGFPEIDFCSNDYLGFSRAGLLTEKLKGTHFESIHYGSGGSRVETGNTHFIVEAEKQIAMFHHAESGLIFNSGYMANIGLVSSVAQKEDLVLYDEMVHDSMMDGIRLGEATNRKFRHNDLKSLKDSIQKHQTNFKNIFIVVESVYSLDGDLAPLLEISQMIKEMETVFLIVDEAHAIGVFGRQGRGLCNALGIENKCFARIYSYGKAMGCQGAIVVGSEILRNYLVNFSRPFIYTTALPNQCLDAILHAYQLLIETDQKDVLQNNIAYFYSKTSGIKNLNRSQSAIHSLVVGSNEEVDRLAQEMARRDLFVKAIKSPLVAVGTERLRFSLHAFNTKHEIDVLIKAIAELS
jgi:8-amino-7-oxononanoate synthase